MPAPTVTPLPAAPLRSMSSSAFIAAAEAWVEALTSDFVPDVNAIAAYLDGLTGGGGAITGTAWTMSTSRILGRVSASTGAIEELTVAQVIALLGPATAAQIMAGTADKLVTADKLHDAHAPQTLTDGATINWDMAAGFNAKVTLGGNRTLGTPTNPKVGLTYVLEVIQDGTGSRTVTWPASFNWGSAGTPTLSTTAAKVDLVTLYCRDAATPKFRAVFNKDS